MRLTRILGAVAIAATLPATAQAANEWGIAGEQKARFTAKVVDIACELTGDCPDNCGDGTRQLGLLRDDGTLVMAMKNFDPFAGAAHDLLPYCNKTAQVDGLMIETPHMPVFAVQFHREPDGKWSRANQWGKAWLAENGGKIGNWFRRDPMVKQEIDANGVFGLPGVEPSAE